MLERAGTGTTILSGSNIYTGNTSIVGGKLIVGNGTSGSLGNTAVTVGGSVASNTPPLGGSGMIGGATIISAANGGAAGTHAPGVATVDSGVGKQTFSSTLSYGAGSIFEWDLNGNTTDNRGLAGGFDAVGGSGSAALADSIIAGGRDGTARRRRESGTTPRRRNP
jgi:fibronectin-binding autotransporter adhesin